MSLFLPACELWAAALFAVWTLTTFSLEPSSDIKPENLLISSDDILKLCDFGKSFCHIILKKHLSLITDTLFQGSGGGSIIFTLKLTVIFLYSVCDSISGSLISLVWVPVRNYSVHLSPCKYFSSGLILQHRSINPLFAPERHSNKKNTHFLLAMLLTHHSVVMSYFPVGWGNWELATIPEPLIWFDNVTLLSQRGLDLFVIHSWSCSLWFSMLFLLCDHLNDDRRKSFGVPGAAKTVVLFTSHFVVND